jgi:thiamine-monophosphate kinase
VIDPKARVGEAGERALLQHLRSRIPEGPGVLVGVGDDAAAVETGPLTLVTTDALVEGVHFLREWSPPRLLGRKALTVNLSDMAAMLATPRYATVSLCLPPDTPISFLDGLYDGLLERAAETGVSIVGGNLSSGSQIVVDVTLLGSAGKVIRRSGALPRAASEGLRLLDQGARLGPEGGLEDTGVWTLSSADALTHCLSAQLDPAPPLSFARSLAEQEFVHAAMDISDGLSGDLWTLCEESGVSAFLDATRIPVDPYALSLENAQGGDARALALHGGEDYELLLAIPPDCLDALRDFAVIWDLPLTVVGDFAEGPAVVEMKSGNVVSPLKRESFQHFRPMEGARGT